MTQVFTINPFLAKANTFMSGQARTITAAVKSGQIAMTDPNGTWPAAEDPTRHIVCWGMQINRGDGVWKWWVWQGDPGSTGFLVDGEPTVRDPNLSEQEPFGIRDKLGTFNMALKVTSTNLIGLVGDQVRPAIQTDADYTFGGQITVN